MNKLSSALHLPFPIINGNWNTPNRNQLNDIQTEWQFVAIIILSIPLIVVDVSSYVRITTIYWSDI